MSNANDDRSYIIGTREDSGASAGTACVRPKYHSWTGRQGGLGIDTYLFLA